MEDLKLDPDQIVRTHSFGGCDLCNRTGVLGRTMLLEALIVDTPLAKRDPIYHALMHNVNDIIHQEGVVYVPRAAGIQTLVRDGLIDPKVGLVLLRE